MESSTEEAFSKAWNVKCPTPVFIIYCKFVLLRRQLYFFNGNLNDCLNKWFTELNWFCLSELDGCQPLSAQSDKMGFWTLEISFHIRPVANMSVTEGREEERGLDLWNGWMESANWAKHAAVSRFCWPIDLHNPTISQLNKEYLFDVTALDRNVIWSWAFFKKKQH